MRRFVLCLVIAWGVTVASYLLGPSDPPPALVGGAIATVAGALAGALSGRRTVHDD